MENSSLIPLDEPKIVAVILHFLLNEFKTENKIAVASSILLGHRIFQTFATKTDEKGPINDQTKDW